jgi:hypothetical protein
MLIANCYMVFHNKIIHYKKQACDFACINVKH